MSLKSKISDASTVRNAPRGLPAYDNEPDAANPRIQAFQDHSWNSGERVFQPPLCHPDSHPRAMRPYDAYGPLRTVDASRPAEQWRHDSAMAPYRTEDYAPLQRPSAPMPTRDFGRYAYARDTRSAPYPYSRRPVGFDWEEFLFLRSQVALLQERVYHLQSQVSELQESCFSYDVPSREYRQKEDAFAKLSHLPNSVLRDFKPPRPRVA
ncbi:hypothetical protein PLEOSDRAFT_1103576 [Pleurotus ostreatus PC15]|uniref:Uncharacterized protein n=1 Tax=Pleurotus ostreatus (strain PC15) TaxID=1137138 RepID=A0A067NNA1_PLEO1|nr:hypothetical protein PLEOSDRAFT_1103576 [Pleurotus ostreatus PC15]